MSLSQTLGQGLMVTGVGLLIVFSVLIILMLVMMLMKKVFYKEPQKAETVQIEKKSDATAINAAPPTLNAAQDPNLIAVLTAAVAVCMNTSTYNLKIKSYRRVDNKAPVWNKAGLNDAINTRY